MAINYRAGTHKDIPAIASYLHKSAGGLSEFLCEGLIEGRHPTEFLELAVADESTNVFYKHTIVAEISGKIHGMINYYPAIKHEIPDIMYSLLSAKKLEIIAPLFEGVPENGLYIYSLACSSSGTKGNIFWGLMIHSFREARSKNYRHVFAHIWPNNHKFLNFVLDSGGKIHRKIPIKPQRQLDYQEEIYLVSFDIIGRN